MEKEILKCLLQLIENMQEMHSRVASIEGEHRNEEGCLPHDLNKIESTLKGLELSLHNSKYDE